MATNARRILFVFVVLLAVALATASVCFSLSAKNGSTAYAADFNPSGQGTEAYPYLIRTAEDLKALAVAVNNAETAGTFGSAYYRIEISGTEKVLECEGAFTPIGTEQFPFNGNFDGNGVILSGLSVSGGDYTGLFGYIGSSGEVTRVGISDGQVSGVRYTGGLAGYNAGSVSECFFEGSVEGEMYVGGLAGENAGVIANSFAKGSAAASMADSYLGGLSGNNSGSIRYCYAQVDVEMTSLGGVASHVGAVTGNGSSITNSYYNTVSEPVYKAIGNDSTGEDVVASNNVRGLSGKEMESNNVSVMFSTSAATYWTRPSVFTLNNDTGYAAPLLKAFFETENNIESDIYGRDPYLAEAVTVRMFGIAPDADFRQWGTQSAPYLIENETHLQNLSYVVNSYARTFAGKYFLVSEDIYMTSEFTPIGSVGNAVAFMGSFDGGSRVIYNLTVDTVSGEPDNAGLFGYLNGATIANLALRAPSVTGVNYVGTVAGRSLNSVFRNVFVTDGTVTATGYGGGLVGSQNGGSVENVFLDVNMVSATTVPSATLYPVIGITEGTAPSPRSNIWYFAPVTRGGVKYLYITSEFGSGLVADDENSVEFSFAGDDAYAFTFTAAMPQGSPMTGSEFRRADESVLGEGEYTPAASANRETVYLRFTRSVNTALIAADSTASQYVFAVLSGETFYEGQEVTLSVSGLHSDKRANNNFYVESVKATDALGQEVANTVTGTPYRYDSVNHVLSFTFTMRASVSEVKVNLNSLTKNNNETLQKVYDGKPAEYTSEAYACPDGFRIRYFYGTENNPTLYGESAPVNASTSYYAVTVAYYNSYGVRVGSVQSLFNITKKSLTYTASADSAVPSVYWGDEGKVRISVRTEDINGLVAGDDVKIFADVTFNDIELSVGTAKPVTFAFVLSGNSANNYAAPASYSGSVGVVLKRPVYIVPGSLTSVYNGAAPTAGETGKINISNSVSSYPVTNSDLVYNFTPLNGIAAGDAGEYALTVSLNSSAAALGDCYEIYLKRSVQSEGVKELTFTVVPLEIELNFVTDGNVYTGKAVSVTMASAKGLGSDSFDDLKAYLSVYSSAGEEIDKIVDAGVYTAAIDLAGAIAYFPALKNYTVKACEFEILRAAQSARLVAGAEVEKAYSVSVAGASFVLGEYFASEAATENYVFEAVYAFDGEVAEDEASVLDGVLTVYGTGSVGVVFKAAGNENYLESDSVVCVFEVVRRDVELSVNDVTVKYGMPIVFEYTVTDACGDEQISYEQLGVTLTPSISAEDPERPIPGEYDVTLDAGTLYSDCFAVNVSGEAATLTVVRRAVSILPDEANAVSAYGEPTVQIPYAVYETVDGASVLIEDLVLSGALSITGETVAGFYPVGEYPITTGTLAEENPYYDISFVEGDYVYTVTPARLSVYLANSEKYFGDPDPEPDWELRGLVGDDTAESLGITVVVTRDAGENAVDGAGNPQYYYYNVFVSGVPADGNYYYEQDAGYNAYLRILQAQPSLIQDSSIGVEAKSSLGDVDISASVRAESATGEAIDGSFEWTDDFIADFAESTSLSFGAVFIPDDPNYAVTEFDVEVSVIPKSLSLSFTGAVTYVYSGKTTPDMTYTVSGADTGDELGVTLEYTGDRVNVGSYTVTALLGNKNYAFSGSDSVKVDIKAAEITVSFEKELYEFTEGDDMDVKLLYSGFVAGEDKDVLIREATFTVISVPGEYTLRASGARADNYTFEYVSSSLVIYRSELVDEESGAVLTGKFPADVSVALNLAESLSEGNADKLYQSIKGAYNILSDKQLKSVYKINYSGQDGYVNPDEITITLAAPEGAAADTLRYLVITNAGEILLIESALYNEDGTVTLTTSDAAYLLLAESVPQDEGGYILYVAIGAAVLVVILIVAIAIALKRRRNARFIRYDDE